MLLQFVFTSLLVNSLGLLSEGSIQLNETRAFLAIISQLVDLKSDHALMKEDHQLVKSNQGLIKSDLGLVKTDQGLIKSNQGLINADLGLIKTDLGLLKANLELIKSGETRLESKLNVLIEKYKQINDAAKEDLMKQPPKVPIGRSCAEATSSSRRNGIYDILVSCYSDQTFKVACDAKTRCGNWTIILRRLDGSVDFYRKWADYKEGFGNLTGEFFLGLDKIHAITNDQPQELLILLEDIKGEVRYEAYDEFAIGDELDWYKLHTLGKATGTAGDSLSLHKGMYFSSQDRDNDPGVDHCAVKYTGGWWYKSCHQSNLMGMYNDNSYGKGVNWLSWPSVTNSLNRAVMMIRPIKI